MCVCNMTRLEIYEALRRACASGEAYVDIDRGVEAAVRTRLKGLGALNVKDADQLGKFLQPHLVSDFAFHQELSDVLMLMAQSSGYWHYWDIDGGRICVDEQPRRVAYRIIKNREFWFRELCGYAHLPVFPVEWLHERLDPRQAEGMPAQFAQRLKEGGELWSFGMPRQHWGPLSYRSGFAVVRDGVPIYEYTFLQA